MSGPDGGPSVPFQAEAWYQPPVWPEEPGLQTKMMHFEVGVDDIRDAVARVIAAGGRVAPKQPADRDANELRVVLDPAGHPFLPLRLRRHRSDDRSHLCVVLFAPGGSPLARRSPHGHRTKVLFEILELLVACIASAPRKRLDW